MMKIDIATLMRRAWKLAKASVKRCEKGTAREYLAESIRMSWALWRKDNARPVRPVTYSLPVAEVAVDMIDADVTVAIVEIDADVAAVHTVAVAVAHVDKTTGFFSKLATTAKKAFTGIKNMFEIKVEIELVGTNG